MQSTGQSGEKKSYRVILLLIVGLAAFSSAMRELNQVQELALETNSLIAKLSDVIAPADKTETLVQVETCEKILTPPVPALPAVPSIPPVEIPSVPPVRIPAIRVPAIRVPAIRVPEVPAVQLDSFEIVVPDPLPPALPRIRVVRSRRSVVKETINPRSASNLIQKRDRRNNG